VALATAWAVVRRARVSRLYWRGNEIEPHKRENTARRVRRTQGDLKMKKTAVHWLRRAMVVAAVAILTGCVGDAPLGLNETPSYPGYIPAPTRPEEVNPLMTVAALGLGNRTVDLGACQNLNVPAGSKLAFRVYAKGVQIYHWNGQGWSFDGPSATLFADAQYNGVVGTHSFGPIWETASGSKVHGAVLDKCTPDASAVAWLLLGATSEGPGVFQGVTHIQRVNTVGGIAPSYSGSAVGEEARVEYSSVYVFYRAP